MPKKLDPIIADILKSFGFGPDACWDCHGTWVVYHKVLEQIAAKASIVFDAPQIIEANSAAGIVAVCVTGRRGDKSEWSFGEAAPKNNKTAYPYAMSEKRAKDRVILKLIGLHGLAYSEEEADDFKAPAPPTAPVEEDKGPNLVALEQAALLETLRVAARQAKTFQELKVWWAQPGTQRAVLSLPQNLRNKIEEFKEDRKAELTANLVEAG